MRWGRDGHPPPRHGRGKDGRTELRRELHQGGSAAGGQGQGRPAARAHGAAAGARTGSKGRGRRARSALLAAAGASGGWPAGEGGAHGAAAGAGTGAGGERLARSNGSVRKLNGNGM